MFIIDVIRYDECENLESILNMINDDTNIGWRNFWPHDFTEEEIKDGLRTLLNCLLIRPIRYDGSINALTDWSEAVDFAEINDFWFRITELGWKKWEQWEPPKSDHRK